MQLFITSLNSGSNGNCYYIGNTRDAVLIDAGISCRETEKRMKRLGLSMDKVRAIFVSHEHSDHIRGIPVLSKKYCLPVYITRQTLLSGGLSIPEQQVMQFTACEPVSIGDLGVIPFSKFHDASEPHSFIVTYKDIRVGVFTDIGKPCTEVTKYFSQCHAAFLEANYDDEMLDSGNYPYYLKQRIRGGLGHLSNRQALELFTTSRSSQLSHLLLSHLSANNNCPELVHDLFSRHAGNTNIVVASRHEETPVFAVGATNYSYAVSPKEAESGQLQFF